MLDLANPTHALIARANAASSDEALDVPMDAIFERLVADPAGTSRALREVLPEMATTTRSVVLRVADEAAVEGKLEAAVLAAYVLRELMREIDWNGCDPEMPQALRPEHETPVFCIGQVLEGVRMWPKSCIAALLGCVDGDDDSLAIAASVLVDCHEEALPTEVGRALTRRAGPSETSVRARVARIVLGRKRT